MLLLLIELTDQQFSKAQLLEIQPLDIKYFFGMLAYGDPNFKTGPPWNHRPIYARSSSIEQYKKSLSYYMPYRNVPWTNDGRGNPTRSTDVNDLIKEMKKFEVRGEGM